MKVLVVVDMQNDFIDGSLGSAEAQSIVPRVVEKLKNIDKTNTLVLFTKDTHYENYLETLEGQKLPVEHCIENTHGWSINKEVSRVVDRSAYSLHFSSDKIKNSRIYKNTFGSDDLRDFLIAYNDQIESVEFIGLCTDICVISNVLMARQTMPDKVITVDASCCAGVTPEKHLAALEVMKSCQIDVIGEE